MNDFESLIDGKLIAAAQSRLDCVTARRGPAQSALTAARAAHAAAQDALGAALVGDGDQDPHKASAAAEAAGRRVAVCESVLRAIEEAAQQASDELRVATGRAWRPVMTAAVHDLMAACGAADKARAQLAVAADDFKTAADAVRHAANMGAAFTGERLDHSSPSYTRPDGGFAIPTVAEMVARLAEPRAWWPGVNADGSIKA